MLAVKEGQHGMVELDSCSSVDRSDSVVDHDKAKVLGSNWPESKTSIRRAAGLVT